MDFLTGMEVAISQPDHLPTLQTVITSELSLLVKSPMPALLLRLLLQCAGDIEMKPGPVSTPTPTNCLRLMQWNANGISGKITELLTFLHNSNVIIAAIHDTKLTNKTKPHKTPGWAAVRLHVHKNKDDGLLMLINDKIPSSTTRPLFHSQPILIWSNKAFRLQCPIANNCISTTSKFRHVAVAALVNASIAHLHSNNEMSLIVGDINAHHPRWDANTNEDESGEQLAD